MAVHANGTGEGFFGRFNRWFAAFTERYTRGVNGMVRQPLRWGLVFAALAAGCLALFMLLPSAFLPDEDQGILFVDVQLPPGASLERTEKIVKEVDAYFRNEEKDSIESVMCVIGWGFSGSGQNSAMVLPLLKDWSKRGPGQSAFDVMERATERFSSIAGAEIVVMSPPAVMELGTSSGFELELMDRGGKGHASLLSAKDDLLESAAKSAAVTSVRYSGMQPWLR